jgi:hypothetical protein
MCLYYICTGLIADMKKDLVNYEFRMICIYHFFQLMFRESSGVYRSFFRLHVLHIHNIHVYNSKILWSINSVK